MSSDPSQNQSERRAAAVRSCLRTGASLAARRSELSAVLNAAAARSTQPVRGHAAGTCRIRTEPESAHPAEDRRKRKRRKSLFLSVRSAFRRKSVGAPEAAMKERSPTSGAELPRPPRLPLPRLPLLPLLLLAGTVTAAAGKDPPLPHCSVCCVLTHPQTPKRSARGQESSEQTRLIKFPSAN